MLGVLGSELHELLHLLLVEQVAVHGESFGHVDRSDLSEATGFVGKITTNVALEELDYLDGIGMVFEGFNEEAIGETSLVLKFLCLSLDLSKSTFSPLQPTVSLTDLVVNGISVDLSVIEVLLVDVSDLGELTNNVFSGSFIGRVLLVSS